MTRRVALALVVLALVSVSIPGAASTTAAQAAPAPDNGSATNVTTSSTTVASTSTDTPRPTPRARSSETSTSTSTADRTVTVAPDERESSSSQSGDGNATILATVDSRLVVLSQSYDAEREIMSVTLRNDGDRDSDVTVSEVISRSRAGSGTFGITQTVVEPGETLTVEVSASRVRGAAAVMVLTRESVEDGSGTYLQERPKASGGLLSGDASGGDVRAAVIMTGTGTLVWAVVGAWALVARRNRDVIEVGVSSGSWLRSKINK